MKYTTVSSLCEGIAESIRRKEGSTEKINPQDFAQRIDNLQVGGGTSESNIEYLDVSGQDGEFYDFAIQIAILAKKIGYILPAGFAKGIGGDSEKITAIAVDFTQKCYTAEIGPNTLQLSQIIDVLGLTDIFSTLPRITKEQFYTLE